MITFIHEFTDFFFSSLHYDFFVVPIVLASIVGFACLLKYLLKGGDT